MPLTVIEYTGFHPGVELGQEVVVSVNGQAVWATLAGRLFAQDGLIRESWLLSDRTVDEGLAPMRITTQVLPVQA